MALENPLPGVGLDNFVANYFAYSSHWDGMNHAVHSTWFGILGETGFLGLGVFITLLTSIITNLQKSLAKVTKMRLSGAPLDPVIQPYLFALMAGLASFMVSGTFLTQGFTWPFYILMSLSGALMKYINELKES